MSDPMHHDDDQYSGRLDWGLWRRIFAHATPYSRAIVGLTVGGLVVAGVDTLFPLVTAKLIDEATGAGRRESIWLWLAGYGGLALTLALGVWLFILLAGRIATGVERDLRAQSFRKLQELSFSYFDARPTGWLISRLTSDCDKLASLIPWFLLDLAWGVTMLIGISIAMFLLHATLAFYVLCIVPPLALVSFYFQRRMIDSSRHVRRTNSLLTASVNEAIMGVRTTKALVREEANLREFGGLAGTMQRYAVQNALQSAVYLPIVILLGSAGVGLALWRGGVIAGDGISLGTLIAFMQYAALFYMPIQDLAIRFTQLQAAQAAAERIQKLLDEVPEIRDSEEVLRAIESHAPPTPSPSLGGRGERAQDGGDIRIETLEFRDVSYWYKQGVPVLHRFNLRAHVGQTVALVGATGGGKTTITALAARFYEPREGEILINGIDYRQRSLAWYQAQLGVILQTPHLFSGTIRENIRYGKVEASDSEVEGAARSANAHDFIATLPSGYDTEVGEGGSKLSTGQRQLVALARAVLADPQVFIMDEATSSVDTETERLIQSGIETILRGRIAFVIAHRLSTIRAADLILVIDGGHVVEQGDHASLIRARGRYWSLYTKQFSRLREEAVLAGAK